MKRIEIINMFRTLGRIKLNKIEDRDLRNTIIADHLKMFRVAKENDEYINSLRTQFDDDAIKDLNDAYQAYANEEIKIDLKKVDYEAFADAVAKGDVDFTVNEFSILDPLFEEK